MKQALRWLPIIAATTLVGPLATHPAFAQSKKSGGKKSAPAAPAPAPAASADIELDAPPSGAQETTDTATPSADAESTGGGAGGICELDPSACPKDIDVKAAAKKDVAAEVYAVQQIYALRAHRFEIQPYWSFTLNDQFVSHPGPGLAFNYYVSNVLAVGLNGNWYGGLNIDSDFNFQNRRATRLAVPLNEYLANANLNMTYVPIYGKFAGFGQFIFHYDAYVVGGVGAIWTRPIAVIDPDNRKFDYKAKVAFNAGLGLRIFFNRWFAANLEVRDYAYNEKLENLKIATSAAEQRDSSKWLGENRITNNVQAQLGVSIFLPFGWEYRLPK
jgi:outer membrane beta-barrel protein